MPRAAGGWSSRPRCLRRCGACSASSSSLAGAVGAVDGEAPAEPAGLGADLVAVALQPRLVVGAPVLGAAGGDLAGAFRLGELDAAGIGEGLLGRIDDLDEVALRAVGRKAASGSRGCPRSGSTGRTAPRSPTARPAQSPAAGSARSVGSWMIASAMRSITARLPVGRIRPGRPTRSPASTSISASANAIDQRAVELALAREPRRERHRRRTVGPDPDGVRGLPFPLAHIEMVVARRAPPVDAARLLAGDEAAELPEVLAGAGAAAAVQAVDHGGGDLARLPGSAAACAAASVRPAPLARRVACSSSRPAGRHRPSIIRCAT